MKPVITLLCTLVLAPMMATGQTVDFGNDASEWAKDGECDDRRFYGAAMAEGLDRDDVGKDATDCKRGYAAGSLKVWDFVTARRKTRCDAVNFGNNSSEWKNDGACDDYRFDGPGADDVLLREDTGKDAADCRALCDAGKIALRNY